MNIHETRRPWGVIKIIRFALVVLLVLSASLSFMLLEFGHSPTSQPNWNRPEGVVSNESRHANWIFYNGVPQTATSLLRMAMMKTNNVHIIDMAGEKNKMWGCKSHVAELWREGMKQYLEDIPDRTIFATGHACYVNFSHAMAPLLINTVREPLARWRSSFDYSLFGARSKENKDKSRSIVSNALGLNSSTEIVNATFEKCFLSENCFTSIIIPEALKERQAFTPCEECREILPPCPNCTLSEHVMRATPMRKTLLRSIALMVNEYQYLIPLDAMATGLELLELALPNQLKNISQLTNRATSNTAVVKAANATALTSVKLSEMHLSFVERGGFRLLYEVAVAKFCHAAHHKRGRADEFCEDFVDSTGTKYEKGIIAGDQRFLVVAEPMRGGLHNQLLAMVAVSKIAAMTNRTLVLPQFLSNFPNEIQVPTEYEDIYDLSAIQRNGVFLSDVVSLRQVPAGLFALGWTTVNIDADPRNIESAVAKLQEGVVDDASLIVLEWGSNFQLMNTKLVIRQYGVFQMNEKLSYAFQDLARFIVGENDIQMGAALESIIVIHLRIEIDWLRYAKKKEADSLKFDHYYQSVQKIQNKFHSTALQRKSNCTYTIFLSYASGYLPDDVPDLHNGWPNEYRVVTSDDIVNLTHKYNYLERTVLTSQIAFKCAIFIGNTFSSFSKIIAEARDMLGHERPSFYYNIPTEFLVSTSSV